MSDSVIDRLERSADGSYTCKCTRDDLSGKSHPDTGVPYVQQTVVIDGHQVTVTTPQFPNAFETQVPESLWLSGDTAIFKSCTCSLAAHIAANPSAAQGFTPRQLLQIQNHSPRIEGFTWHHTAVPGIMQLVNIDLHENTRHTGGNVLWCKGIR